MSTRLTTTVISLRDARRSRVEHKMLCRSGFHKWQVETDGRFGVKAGKLLTV